jgi:hypothetical protein
MGIDRSVNHMQLNGIIALHLPGEPYQVDRKK